MVKSDSSVISWLAFSRSNKRNRGSKRGKKTPLFAFFINLYGTQVASLGTGEFSNGAMIVVFSEVGLSPGTVKAGLKIKQREVKKLLAGNVAFPLTWSALHRPPAEPCSSNLIDRYALVH